MLCAAAAPAAAQLVDPEIWVVQRDAGRISIIDQAGFTNLTSFDISDPDGNSTIDPPWDICFSTPSSHPGTHAFVTQGRLLTVIEVTSRAIVGVHDIASLLGVPDVSLRGCAAATPRELTVTGGPPVVTSYLHVAATLPTGDAHFVVLDQDLLITTGTFSPVVDSGLLAAQATAQDAAVMDTPGGRSFQRVWYSATRPGVAANDELVLVLVTSEEPLSSAWAVEDTRTAPLPLGQPLPDMLRLGVPPGRELPVLPTAGLGTLENLGTGGSCDPGGDLRAVTLTGPSPNSYTALALDGSSGEVVVVDPKNCSSLRYSVGADPTDVAALGRLDWREAYVVSRGDDTITRLKNDGSLTTIGFGLPIAGPTAVGITLKPWCSVKNIRVFPFDQDGDGQLNDYKLTWDGVDCPAGTQYEIGCFCTSTSADCPCTPCDCTQQPPGDGCYCPGVIAMMPPVMEPPDLPLQVQIADPEEPDVLIEAPWKMLGLTSVEEFVHEDQAGNQANWDYTVEPQDDP